MLDNGFIDVCVLDISGEAILDSMKRLESRTGLVNWKEADITTAKLPENHFDLWHDRGVFHFLTDADDLHKYVELVMRSVKLGGHIIVASFGGAKYRDRALCFGSADLSRYHSTFQSVENSNSAMENRELLIAATTKAELSLLPNR